MKYYSEHTEELYDSIAELEEAEANLAEENMQKAREEAERKEAEKEVNEAFAIAREAKKYAQEKLSEFCKKYGYFSADWTIPNNSKIDITDLIRSIFH